MMKCEECSKPYVPYLSKQRFCCSDCRYAWRNRQYYQIKSWWLERQQVEEDDEARVA